MNIHIEAKLKNSCMLIICFVCIFSPGSVGGRKDVTSEHRAELELIENFVKRKIIVINPQFN